MVSRPGSDQRGADDHGYEGDHAEQPQVTNLSDLQVTARHRGSGSTDPAASYDRPAVLGRQHPQNHPFGHRSIVRALVLPCVSNEWVS
jgi:hypothetical protein